MKTTDRDVGRPGVWLRRVWITLIICILVVSFAALIFRWDGMTLEHDTLLTIVYFAMIGALWIGFASALFLVFAYVRRMAAKHP